jgi:hypothetical protein
MTLKELQDGVREDLKIQGDELTFEAVRTPDIHHKYNKMLMAERLALKKLEREWEQLYLQQWEYYRKKADPVIYEKKPLLKKIMDSDVKLYLASDEILLEHRAKMEGKEELIDFLKRTMEQVAQRTWLIKNALDNYKYLQGDK